MTTRHTTARLRILIAIAIALSVSACAATMAKLIDGCEIIGSQRVCSILGVAGASAQDVKDTIAAVRGSDDDDTDDDTSGEE